METTINPAYDKNVPLECGIIADILGLFLKSDPQASPAYLPEFRLQQLFLYFSASKSDPATVIESVGGIISFCLFHATSPVFAENLPQVISTLEMIISECIALMEEESALIIVHPADIIKSFESLIIDQDITSSTFELCMSLSKELLREITRQVRTARDHVPKKYRVDPNNSNSSTNTRQLIDCYQLHSLYFFSVFALTHIALVANTEGKLDITFGSLETLLLVLVTLPVSFPPSFNTKQFNKSTQFNTTSSQFEVEDISSNKGKRITRFNRCIELASRLGYCVLKSINPKLLEELFASRKKRLRQMTHPDVTYLNTTISLQSFLYGKQSTSEEKKKTDKSRKDSPMRTDNAAPPPLRFIPAGTYYLVGTRIPDGMRVNYEEIEAELARREEQRKYETGDYSSSKAKSVIPAPANTGMTTTGTTTTGTTTTGTTAREGRKTGEPSATATAAAAAAAAAANKKLAAEISEFWSLPKWARGVYLATRALRAPKRSLCKYLDSSAIVSTSNSQLLSRGDAETSSLSRGRSNRRKPLNLSSKENTTTTVTINNITDSTKGLQNSQTGIVLPHVTPVSSATYGRKTLLQLAKEKEEQYLIFFETYGLPRCMDPAEGMYWVIEHVIKYLLQQSQQVDGVIFRSDNLIMKSLNLELQQIKQERQRKNLSQEEKDKHSNSTLSSRYLNKSTFKSNSLPFLDSSVTDYVNNMYGPPKSPSSSSSIRSLLSRGNLELPPSLLATSSLAKRLKAAEREAKAELTRDSFARKTGKDLALLGDSSPEKTEGKSSNNSNSSNGVSAVYREETPLNQNIMKTDKAINNEDGSKEISVVWARGSLLQATDSSSNKSKAGVVIQSVLGFESLAAGLGVHGGLTDKQRQEEARAYAAEIKKYQECRRREEEKEQRQLEDKQEMEIGALKTYRVLKTRKEAEEKEQTLQQSKQIRRAMAEANREATRKERLQLQQQYHQKAEADIKERYRIREIKEIVRMKADREISDRLEREEMERIHLKKLTDKAEQEEIIRRIQEESRMRYLEGLQLKREKKREEISRSIKLERKRREREFRQKQLKIAGRIRLGNFVWHRGKLGFYDDVHQTDDGWIQYEDAQGIPYYYDTMTKKTQYEKPEGEEPVHYTVIEKAEYDQLHGEGAYEVLLAERRWKDQCNADGGYFDDRGDWVQLHGYYDENYEFVDLDAGYFDENGEWTLFEGNVMGTLDFMV